MSTLRVALVGCGHNGLAHARCYHRDSRCELVAVCDVNEDRAKAAAAEFEAQAFSRVEDLLDSAQPDLVTINTGDPFHVEPFVAACEAGCHVFVEKPMADTIEGLDRMCEAAASNPGKTMVGQILRFNPYFMKVKELCATGALGELFYLEADYLHNLFVQADPARYNPAIGMNWYTQAEHPAVGGGCHAYDLLRWFADSEAVEVSGYANRIAFPAMHNPDCQVFLAKLESGAVAKVASAYGPVGPRPPVNHLSVYGTRGTVREFDLWLGEGHEAEHHRLDDLLGGGHPYEPEVDHFVTAIVEDQPTLVDAFSGANSAATCILGAAAASCGRALRVPRYPRSTAT